MNFLKKFNQHLILENILAFIFAFYINFYSINSAILTKSSSDSPFQHLLSFSLIACLISGVGLSYYVMRNLSKNLFIKLGISYIAYLLTSYFIIITRNLNNKDFDIWQLQKNNFFQWKGLLIVAILLVISLIYYFVLPKIPILNQKNNLIESNNSNQYIIALLVSFFILNDTSFVTAIADHLPDFTTLTNYSTYTRNALVTVIELLFIFSIINLLILNALSHIKHIKTSLSLAFTTSLAFGILFNYTLQYGVRGNSDLAGKYIVPGGTVYQIVIITLFSFLCYVLINRYIATTLFLTVLGIAISIANILKESMRSEPLLITDFTWIQEINTVLSFVNSKIIIYIILAIVLPIIIYFVLRKFTEVQPIVKSWKLRVSTVFLLILSFVTIFTSFKYVSKHKETSHIPVISSLNNWASIEWMGFNVNAKYKSVMFVWSKQLTMSVIEEPSGYSQQKISSIYKKYDKLSKEINKTRSNNIKNQTVIYVLSESLSNPNRIPAVSLQEDLLPNIDAIKEQTTSGLMQSDGFGGGTANMEFQTLTGLPFYNYSSSVSTLYTEVVPKMSYFPSISDQFSSKNRIVIHPASASSYSRKYIYNRLNFDKLIFETGGTEKLKNVENTGIYPSDQTVYNNVIDNINTKENQFFSVITMQNHALWSIGDPSDLVVTGEGFPQESNDYLTSYSRLLTHTDTYTKEFLDNLSKINKNITVVFYGDHLPGFYPDSAFKEAVNEKHETDYFIWSNHQTKKLNHPLVNSSDFTAELLEHTNSKVSPYYALLTQVLENASVDKTTLSKSQKEIANDLKMIQYDITLGKDYIGKHKKFFNIGD